MKRLQNNFTTPEQSKRLLSLGVPADSADCIYSEGADVNEDGVVSFDYTDRELLPIKTITGEQMAFSEYKEKYTNGYVLPCWSVGRLIEIDNICSIPKIKEAGFHLIAQDFDDLIETMIISIKMKVEHYWMDFSKLEE